MQRRAIISAVGGVALVGLMIGGYALSTGREDTPDETIRQPISLNIDSEGDEREAQSLDPAPTNSQQQQLGATMQPDSAPTNDSNTTNEFSQYQKYQAEQNALTSDIVVGDGAEATAGQKVTVHYRGWLTNGEIFDESYKRGQAFSFNLGAGQVIRGWDEGVQGMKVGGKRRLIVPPAAGYGSQAVGSIPAGSVLIFDVELLGVE